MNLLRRLGESRTRAKLRKASFQPDDGPPRPNVAVLFVAADLQEQQTAQHFAKQFDKDTDRQPNLMGFIKKKLSENVTFGFTHYSLNDLDWTAKPVNDRVVLFTQRSYHAVINLDRHDHISLHYLAHLIRAKHKLAICPSLPNLYDVVLDIPEDLAPESLNEQIIEIFQQITS